MGHGEHDDEPLDEGHEDEHASKGAPPDPLDRVWVHPTELPPLASGFVPGTRAPTIRRPRLWLLPVAGGAAGALVTVAALAIGGVFDRESTPGSRSAADSNPATAIVTSAPAAAARTGLSVVAIAARDAAGMRRGSGVCVRHAGDVLTSARLVGNARTVDVVTRDGEKHIARVVGRDPSTDLVLLTIDDASNIPAAKLADHTPSAGSPVWIVGAASAGTSSLWMSSGMLSSTDSLVTVAGGLTASGLLETDATAGEQASGGALIDEDGGVVGIVLRRVATNDTTYAMPIRTAVAIAEQLYAHGTVRHGSAGFDGVDGAFGPTIRRVTPYGPAARSGVRVGDVVMAVDNRAVESMKDVIALVRTRDPGEIVTFEIRRGREDLNVRVVLAATG